MSKVEAERKRGECCREVVNMLIKEGFKREVEEGGRERINRVVEISSKGEVSEGRRK